MLKSLRGERAGGWPTALRGQSLGPIGFLNLMGLLGPGLDNFWA